MKKKYLLDIQLFATTSEVMNTTGSEGMSAEMKKFYDMTLIDIAGPKLVHDQFADKRPIPQGKGKTVEFRKYDNLPKAMTPLVEGVTPVGGKLNVTTMEATVEQYGYYVTVTDMLKMTAIDDNIVQASKKLGNQAGLTLDCITRDVLAGGTSVYFPNGKEARDELTLDDGINETVLGRAKAHLRTMDTPEIDGAYIGIIHPEIEEDLTNLPGWIDVAKYNAAEKIYDGEIGKYKGIRFVTTSNAKVWKDDTCPAKEYFASEDTEVDETKTYYTRSGSAGSYVYTKVDTPTGNPSTSSYYEKDPLAVFSVLIVGSGAFATTSINGGGLQMIVKQLGSGEDPLNQRATVGWKATKVSERLVEQYMTRIECTSSVSASVEAN